jgi:HSP20 family protein
VSLEGSELTIEGTRAPGEEPKGEVVTLEASCSDFRRTFVVPPEVDADGIRAEIENGVLRVHLPKAAAREPRSIPIKAR